MKIEITSGPDQGRTETIRGDRFTLGREGSTNMVLRDAKASRQHAYFTANPDGTAELHDMGSSNGTFVDGQQVQTATLRGGEEIRIGDTTMRAVPDAPQPAAAPPPPAAAPPPPAAAPPPPPSAPPPPPGAAAPPPPPMTPPGFPPPTQDLTPRQPDAPAPGPSPSTIQRLVIQRGIKRVTVLGIVVLVLVVGLGAALALGVFTGDDAGEGTTPAEVVDNARPSTVLVVNDKGGGSGGRGSGWVWDANRGIVVTNAHVTNGGQGYSVSTGDKLTIEIGTDIRVGGEGSRDAELKGEALCEDIAVLEVEDSAGLRTMARANQKQLKVGDEVVAVGYPSTKNLTEGQAQQEADLTGNTGVISTVQTTFQAIPGASFEDPTVGPYNNVILTDTVINQGNSGGPLVNMDTKLVGMNSAIRTDVQGQNYAIGVDRITEIVPKLIEGDDVC